ncbi:TPA: hypothetical protein QDB28_006259 [Burkholderia vietnamiensis]|nr:hypothetical protein [Burkholderia vietnamiensis]
MSEIENRFYREADKINDGGPAFPVTFENSTRADGFGMSLRDYFAAKAMQGMLANTDMTGDRKVDIVREAYGFADEMLRARGEA